jgi:hypothetical protein
VLAAIGWMGFRAFQLQRGAESARQDLKQLEASVRASDFAAAHVHLADADRHAATARSAAHDPLWRLAAKVPKIGVTFQVTTGVADAVSDTTRLALPGVLSAAEAVDPQTTVHRTTVNLAPFRKVAGQLTSSAAVMNQVVARLDALPSNALGPVGKARRVLLDQLRPLSESVTSASVGARVLPQMLGANGTKRYFVAAQNSAEQRASGGLIGAFAIFTARNGTVTLERTGVNDDLKNLDRPALDLGADFKERYGRLSADRLWVNLGLSPDFPTTAKTVKALWDQTEPEKVDGVLAIDPVGLSYLLEATGPVRMGDGVVLTSANVVQETLSGYYYRFQGPTQAPRNEYLKQTIRRSYDKVLDGGVPARKMLERVGRAVREGHIQLYAADAGIQRELSRTRITGALPQDAVGFLQVVTQNTAGNKLDYYLRRTIRYDGRITGRSVDVGKGPQPEEEGVVTITLRNLAPPSGLPQYVSVRSDKLPGQKYTVGQNRVWVSVYLGAGGQLEAATVDGVSREMTSQVEKGLSVFSTEVTIDPGGSATLRLHVFQPVQLGRELLYRAQPMAFPETVVAVRR